MNCNAKLRKWLSSTPRPATVLCGEQRLDAPKVDRGWAEIAETIEQLKPDSIVCVDKSGTVLRAKSFEYFFPRDDDEAPLPVPTPTTPEQATLQHFGVLLANAHTSAAATHGPILAAAMEFTERLSARLAKTEAELDKARSEIVSLESELAELQAKAAPPQGDDLVSAFTQGIAMRGAAAAPANGGKS